MLGHEDERIWKNVEMLGKRTDAGRSGGYAMGITTHRRLTP